MYEPLMRSESWYRATDVPPPGRTQHQRVLGEPLDSEFDRAERVLPPASRCLRPAITRQDANRLVTRLRDGGVLMGLTGRHGNVLKIRPPLPFGRDHADHALEVLDECLREFGEMATGDASSSSRA